MSWEELKKIVLDIKKKRKISKRIKWLKETGKGIKYESSITILFSKKKDNE